MYAKRLLAILLLSTACDLSAAVLLERINHPGYVAPGYAVSSVCSIDDNGLMAIRYQLGSELSSDRGQQMRIPVGALRSRIRAASKGEIQEEQMPVDGPTWIYRAWRQGGDTPVEVPLYEENGGMGLKRVNQEPAALELKNFIDLNCDGSLRY